MNLKDKTLFITGASRGIGLAIALRAARDGANIALFAKTAEVHPHLPGTIYTAAAAIEAAGGKALPLLGDVRFEDQVAQAIGSVISHFGRLDVLVNNASAISLSSTPDTSMKRFDLMNQVNARGTFLCTKLAAAHLKEAPNPHVLNISPPLDMRAKWFAPHVAYTIAKYGMSLCTLGHAEEFRGEGIAVNSLWPLTTIDTAALRTFPGADRLVRASRKPAIMADAAAIILTRPARETSGNFFIDEEVLRSAGVSDFSLYANDPGGELMPDFFLPEETLRASSTRLAKR
jgi:citronellol/citronellal dehydrogenase